MGQKIKVKYFEDELMYLKALVKSIMEEDINARNSDKYLIASVYFYITGKRWWSFDELLELPNPESIIRIRARLQNYYKVLLPTEEVNKFRSEREVIIRETIGNI